MAERDFGERAAEVLAHAVTALGSAAPERRYVAAGAPAWDCDQLTVHVSSVRLDPPGRARADVVPHNCIVVPTSTFVVTLVREVCSADDALPKADDLDTEGINALTAARDLLDGLVKAWFDGNLMENVSCQAIGWSPGLVSLGVQGGYVGYSVTFTAQI